MNKKILFLILIFLAAGIFLRLNMTGHTYGWDESSYLQNAEILGNFKKDNFNELEFRPVLSSLIFAGLFKIWHNPLVANLVITILGALSILVIYKIGELMFNWRIGLIAAFILTFCNSHIVLSRTVLTHVPALFFALCCLYLIKLGEKNNRLVYFAFSAFCAALAVLTRFTYLMLIPIFGINLVLFAKKYDFKKMLVLATAFIATMAPYLYWSFLKFNNPLYTFKQSQITANWGIPSPLILYAVIIPVLLGGLCIIGISLWLGRKRSESISRAEILLVAWASAFLIFSLSLPVKETRYLLGALPAFILFSALGFNWLFDKLKTRRVYIMPVTIILIVLIAVLSALTNQQIVQTENFNYPIREAALFLENQSVDVVYTHHAFTQLAYYTNKTIVLAPFNKTRFLDMSADYMNKPGYYLYFKDQEQISGFAKPEEFDGRFKLLTQFGEDSSAVFVFEYTPSHTS